MYSTRLKHTGLVPQTGLRLSKDLASV